MLFIILLIFSAFVSYIFYIKSTFIPIAVAFFAIFAMFSGLICKGINDTIIPAKIINTDEVVIDLYSLNNKNDIQGSFILGSGMIDSIENYYMFIDVGDGGIERGIIPARNTTIYMGNYKPQVKYNIYTMQISKWVFVCPWYDRKYIVKSNRYNLYVPKNTIIQKYELN